MQVIEVFLISIHCHGKEPRERGSIVGKQVIGLLKQLMKVVVPGIEGRLVN